MINRIFKQKLLATGLTITLTAGLMSSGVYAEETDSTNSVFFEETDELTSDVTTDASEVDNVETQYADSEDVRVFIVLEDNAVVEEGYATEDIVDNEAAMSYSDELVQEQEEVVDKITEEVLDGEELEVRYNYTILTNAVATSVEYGDIEAIEQVDGVSAVYVVPQYEKLEDSDSDADVNTITSGNMVGSYDTWESGYTGAGMRIAVIDTGLDIDHPSFDSKAFEKGLKETAQEAGNSISDYDLLDKSEIRKVLDTLNADSMYEGMKSSRVYLNKKVPFAFNYVDQSIDVTHDNDTQGDHGTHVAGIATANRLVPTTNEKGKTVYEEQESGVVGIAPDAQLLVMKVFGQNGGAYSDDYMAAIEDAIILGADTINLSLGSSSAGNSASGEAYIDDIFNELMNTDAVVCISAGNAGSFADSSQIGGNLTSDVNTDTVGSPGSYTNAFTVASANNSGYTGYSVEVDSTQVFYTDAAEKTFASLDTLGSGTEYEYVFLDSYGEVSDYADIDVTGKIVMVSRGGITFSEKHMNAEAAGAIGILVYNNTTGTIGMSIADSTATIPCASFKQAEANAIRSEAVQSMEGVYTGTITVYSTVKTDYNADDGYTMSNFSSWGVSGDLSLKPEITAPGGNIYSTRDDGTYGLMSGTSMSSPSTAGMAALVKQYIEENDLASKTGISARTLSQSLLMSTSIPLMSDNGVEYSPRNQGSGLANVYAATTSDCYILVGDEENNDGKVKAQLGDDPNKTGEYSFDFTVYNMSEEDAYYDLESSILTAAVEDGLLSDNEYELSPEVTFTADSLRYLYDLNDDGRFNSKDSKIFEKYVKGKSCDAADLINNFYDEFDFTDDGVVDKNDYNYFKKVISGKYTDVDLTTQVFSVDEKATVHVDVVLSDADREYLESNFENGMYVEGFIYLNGEVTLSIPMLAFYGNWADSSMYEPYNYLEAANQGTDEITYSGVASTNYLAYTFAGSQSSYKYASNMFATDTEYMADRNAFSSLSGDTITSMYYTLIRNASSVTATITNADTGEVYYEKSKGSETATYYSSSAAAWQNTLSNMDFNYSGTDAAGNPLEEGTKINISVDANLAYNEGIEGASGRGTSITIPMTIDNTAPEVDAVIDNEDGTMNVSVTDNRYTAAVYVYASDKETVLDSYAVGQTVEGESKTVTINYPESVFYLKVIDYAGNSKSYRVNKSGEPDTEYVTGLSLSMNETTVLKGGTVKLKAVVTPVTVIDDSVIFTSSDESVATVDQNGVVTGVSDGVALITATTNAYTVDGMPLTASCTVTVETLNASLNGIVWDENGEVYWSSFETAALGDYDKLSTSQGNRYMSAAVAGDKIYAATYGDNQRSEIYVVDPADSYSSQLLTDTYWCTDLAYSTGSDLLYGTYAYYVQLIDRESGESLGLVNLSRYTEGDYFVGLTYAGSEEHSLYGTIDWMYLVSETGELYQLGYVPSLSGYFFYDLGNTGVNTNGQWYYNSLYLDEASGYLFWAMYDNSNNVTMYAIDHTYDVASDTDVINTFNLGKFPDGVWPVSGLYSASELSTGVASSQLTDRLAEGTAIENAELVENAELID